MSRYLGDYATSTIIYGKFTTYRPSTGAPFTLGGSPALSVYKDDSLVQSISGVILTPDFDAVTGLNHFAIDTSADGTFYSAGSNFDIVITTGTVDSVSFVGATVASFSLQKTSALRPTTAGRTLDVTAGGEAGIDWANIGSPTTTVNLSGTSTKAVEPTVAGRTLDVSATGEAGIDWANIGSPTTSVALTGTTIATTQKVDVETIKTNPVVNGGTVTFPTNETLASTTNITAGTITTVTNLTNAPTNGDFTATMKTSITTAATAATPTVAAVSGNVGGNVVGNVNGSVGSVVGNVGGNVLGSVASVAASGITSSSLAASALTSIENTVWNAVLASHLTAGSTGAALNSASSAGDPWGTSLPGAYAVGTAGYIVGNNLNAAVNSVASSVWAVGTRTLTSLGNGSGLTAIPWNSAWNTDVQTNVNTVFNTAQTEAYSANGSTFSIVQGLYRVHQMLQAFAISGVNYTVHKLDGSTTAFTLTLNSATDPTAMSQ